MKTVSVNSSLLHGGKALDGITNLDAVLDDIDSSLTLNQADAATIPTFMSAAFADGPLSDTTSATNLLPNASGASAPLPVNSPSTMTIASGASAPLPISSPSTITITNGASAEIDGVSARSVTFTGTTGTLKLGDSLAYTGHVTGLAGDDAIDLSDVRYGADTQATFSGNTTGGTLTITDGSQTANIALNGNYLASGWTLSSDGKGGTLVVDPVASNTWKPIKIGAGGYLTGIDVAPDGTMVVRTDTYGAYIWNGTQWQQLVTSTSMPAQFVAPDNGQGVYEIQVSSSDSNILYMMYEGYVFRSDNKGATWTKTAFSQVTESPNDPSRLNGQKMAIDPNNPNVVYVGTPQNGLFVTADGGATWKSVAGVPISATNSSGAYPGITGIEFVPGSGTAGGMTKTIIASSYGHGVYESIDGGASWSKLSGGPSDVEYAAVSSTGVYYAVGNQGTSVWSFADGKWTEVLSGSSTAIHTIAVDPFNPNHIVAANMGGGLDESFNGGATWGGWNWNPQLNANDIPWLASTGPGMSLGGMVFDPLVEDKLWAASGVGVWNTTIPQNMKSNTPIVWNSQSVGIEQLVANDLIVPVGGKPVLASWDRSFFYVNDPNSYPTTYGVSGQRAFAAGWSLDYASSNPNFVVGIADWWGVEESGFSTDGGKDWQVFPTEPPFAYHAIGGSIAASSPTDIVWAPADGASPYYTQDGGVTWKPVVLPGVSDWSEFDYAYYLDRRTVTADRVLSNTFYMYYLGTTNTGVYRSTDGGASWAEVFAGQISPSSGFNAQIQSVPGEAGNLFFTGGPQDGSGLHEKFFQSADGGVTWNAVPNVTEVSCFGFGKSATLGGYPSIYVVGFVNGVYGVWQSNNDAKSWTQIGQWPVGELSNIKTISGDPNTYGQVYVGFAGTGYAYLPAIAGVTEVIPSIVNGDVKAGQTITLTLNLSAALTIAGGIPTLTLNDGGTAIYSGGSGTNALTFSYTVAAGQNTPDLAVVAVNLNSATVTDGSGTPGSLDGAVTNPAGVLQIDTINTTVTSATDTPVSGILDTGKTVIWTVDLSQAVTIVGGIPTLTLNDGGKAVYTSGSGTNVLTFTYTVLAGQNTPDLAVTGVNLNSASITDGAGNVADLTGVVTNLSNKGNPATLQINTKIPIVSSLTAQSGDLNAGDVVTLTVHMTEAVTVLGGRPRLTLNDGGTANYTGGSGTNSLTFNYTVAPGQNTADLAVAGFDLGTATIKDTAGNIADLSGAITRSVGNVQIDTTKPVVSSITDSPSNGDLNAGEVVILTLHLSEAVTVAGGIPALNLNDGGTAVYKSGSGTNTLTFSYTVAAGQNTADLRVAAVDLNSATVVDAAGNAANLSGALVNPGGTLQIDTRVPTVIRVGESLVTGSQKSVVVTVRLSEAVGVWGGTPTLTLNNGDTATYTGGSGTDALTFSYKVPTGQSTSNLAMTAMHLNSSTIEDGAGNVANLAAVTDATVAAGAALELATAYSGTVVFAGPTGTLKIDDSSTFNGKIGGQLAIGDVIDLSDVTAGAKATLRYSGHASAGTLTVSDGTHTDNIALLGHYSLGNFTASSDGHGGTLVIDPPLPSDQSATTPSEYLAHDPAGSLGAVDQQMALWAQHMASAFPSAAFGNGGVPTVGHSQSGGDQSYLAQPVAGRQPR